MEEAALSAIGNVRRGPIIIDTSMVVASLYLALLGRNPRPEEVAVRVDVLSAGKPLAEMIVEIEASEEALNARCGRLVETLTNPRAREQILACPLPLRAEDVFTTIGAAYQTALGRVASFEEVAAHFAAIVSGERLSDRLQSIADSEVVAPGARPEGPLDTRSTFAPFIGIVYTRCLKRSISESEIDIWYNVYLAGATYREILTDIDASAEAVSVRSSTNSEDWDDGTFIQLLYELIVGRGAAPVEIDHYRRALATGTTRDDLLRSFFVQFGREALRKSQKDPSNDPTMANLFGRSKIIGVEEWNERDPGRSTVPIIEKNKHLTRFEFVATKSPLVSIITSLFKGGRYIEAFLENMTSQSIFRKHCELLIIDANSPEGEFDKAQPFLDRFDNISYKRLDAQIGIYEAWNMGIREARGDYITNANLDDCRRHDSFEIQASTLDALPFVDVVYQDVLYSFTENLDFDTIARYDFATELPVVSRYNLLEFNSPHNGPMWRKTLHQELGLFDSSFRSAGDFDFWLRCVLNGKIFYKINDPHVAYYVNPRGLSTRADTPGAMESNRITKAVGRDLVSPYLTMSDSRFAKKLLEFGVSSSGGVDRYAIAQSALREISRRSRAANQSTVI